MSEQDAYYREVITLQIDRVTVLTLVGACILALKHPQFPRQTACMLRATLKNLVTLVDRYAPDEILAEWEELLWGGGQYGG